MPSKVIVLSNMNEIERAVIAPVTQSADETSQDLSEQQDQMPKNDLIGALDFKRPKKFNQTFRMEKPKPLNHMVSADKNLRNSQEKFQLKAKHILSESPTHRVMVKEA